MFHLIVPVINDDGVATALSAVSVGDRVVMDDILIGDGRVQVSLFDRASGEPFTVITQYKTLEIDLAGPEPSVQVIETEPIGDLPLPAPELPDVDVRFEPGAVSAAVPGSIEFRQRQTYTVQAAAGQAFTATLGAPIGVWLDVRLGDEVVAAATERYQRVEATLPAAGAWRVTVVSAHAGPADYQLTVEALPLGSDSPPPPTTTADAPTDTPPPTTPAATSAGPGGVVYLTFDDTIGRTQAVLSDRATPCLRPPYGSIDAFTREWATALGLDLVLWTVDTNDWRRPGAQVIADRIVRGATDEAIVLMHDGGGNRTQTVEGLELALDRLSGRACGSNPSAPEGPSPRSAVDGRTPTRPTKASRVGGHPQVERDVTVGARTARLGRSPSSPSRQTLRVSASAISSRRPDIFWTRSAVRPVDLTAMSDASCADTADQGVTTLALRPSAFPTAWPSRRPPLPTGAMSATSISTTHTLHPAAVTPAMSSPRSSPRLKRGAHRARSS